MQRIHFVYGMSLFLAACGGSEAGIGPEVTQETGGSSGASGTPGGSSGKNGSSDAAASGRSGASGLPGQNADVGVADAAPPGRRDGGGPGDGPRDGGFQWPGGDGGFQWPGGDGGFQWPGGDGGFQWPGGDGGLPPRQDGGQPPRADGGRPRRDGGTAVIDAAVGRLDAAVCPADVETGDDCEGNSVCQQTGDNVGFCRCRNNRYTCVEL